MERRAEDLELFPPNVVRAELLSLAVGAAVGLYLFRRSLVDEVIASVTGVGVYLWMQRRRPLVALRGDAIHFPRRPGQRIIRCADVASWSADEKELVLYLRSKRALVQNVAWLRPEQRAALAHALAERGLQRVEAGPDELEALRGAKRGQRRLAAFVLVVTGILVVAFLLHPTWRAP